MSRFSLSVICISVSWRCLSTSSPLISALRRRYFITVMCQSRELKLLVSILSFQWRLEMEFSDWAICTSKEEMFLLFYAQMSSRRWIQASISFFWCQSSSASIYSFLLANSSLVSCSVSTDPFSLCLLSSSYSSSRVLLRSCPIFSQQLNFQVRSLPTSSLALISLSMSSILTSKSLRKRLSSSSFLILSISIWQFFSFWNWLTDSSSKAAFWMSLFSLMLFQYFSFSTSVASWRFWISSWRACSLRASNYRTIVIQPVKRVLQREVGAQVRLLGIFEALLGVYSFFYIQR